MRPGIRSKQLLLKFKHFFQIKKRANMGSELEPSSPSPSLPSVFSANMPHIAFIARRLDGKLLLREELPISDPLFQQLLTNHYLSSIPTIYKHFSHFECMRCHNENKQLFGVLPCSRCHRSHVYCRNCIEMGRIMACEKLYYWTGPAYTWKRHEKPCTWLGELNDAQQSGANQIQTVIKERKQLIVWAVTGAGKTEMLFPGMDDALRDGLRICVASPRMDVVRELLPRFKAAFRDVSVQALHAGSRDNDGTAQLLISTAHQLYRYRHAFDVLIIDEVDAFPFHKSASLQQAANRAKKEEAAVIYLTATPRSDQLKKVARKQAALVFVPIRFHGHPLILPRWITVPSLTKHLQKLLLPKQVTNWIRYRKSPARQLIIFVPTIRLADQLEESIRQYLLKIQVITRNHQITGVHADDPDRQNKVTDFRQKKIYCMVTTTILERGVTFPSVDVAVLDAGHDVFDEAALVQITGRAGRSPKDPDGEVVFFHDGLTNEMVKANHAITKMNKRRHQLLNQGGKA